MSKPQAVGRPRGGPVSAATTTARATFIIAKGGRVRARLVHGAVPQEAFLAVLKTEG
ncbi:MAG: hypothetical protein V3T41_07245 [bacterium]